MYEIRIKWFGHVRTRPIEAPMNRMDRVFSKRGRGNQEKICGRYGPHKR